MRLLRKVLGDFWKDGYVSIGEQRWDNGLMVYGGSSYVNEQTIGYIVKYVNKSDEVHKEYKSRVFTSAGIGSAYLDRVDCLNNKFKEGKTNETYVTRTGMRLALAVYYRNKLYSDEEREVLWLEKLDKQER